MWSLIILVTNFLLLLNWQQVSANDGTKILNIPNSCAQILENTTTKSVGVYMINVPSSELPPFNVYCDYTGWTIIQRRMDGSENFYRNWQDYKRGFGDLYGEFWLGLDRIHALTKDRPHALWIKLVAFDGSKKDAFYHKFYVAGEDEGYQLTAEEHNGDAGDGLKWHNGMKFSTYDKNHSPSRLNCPVDGIGAFWYSGCAYANLNGLYRQSPSRDVFPNIHWPAWRDYESMKYVHMAIHFTS